MRKMVVTLLVCLFLIPTFAFAQLKQDGKLNMAQALTKPQEIVGLFGLDPNKFSMSHSYSLSFSSFGGNSFSRGLYLNTMMYQLSNPLKMYFQFGVQHQPFGSDQFQNRSQFFISGAGVEYKPSDNFKLQFEFSQTPGYYSPYHYSGFRRSQSVFDKKDDSSN